MSRIAVIGAGYVGLTTGACLAHLGHQVICADVDPDKVAQLQSGIVPIVERGLPELVSAGCDNGRLTFTTDSSQAVAHCDIVFLCVPTPQGDDGSADLTHVQTAAKQISRSLPFEAIVVNKSTVPVGSTKVVEWALERPDVRVVSNPEFLREGSAVADFLRPDRIVVGGDDQAACMQVADLYRDLSTRVIITDPASAETIKYAANAFLATKLSFINAIAAICEGVGADIDDVVVGMGSDHRIGQDFLRPGPGWGGSCFPKDSRALVKIAETAGYRFSLLEGVIAVNHEQLDRVARKILGPAPQRNHTVAIWGLTFKANTDDLRDSPALAIIDRLLEAGVTVRAFDSTCAGPRLGIPSSVALAESPLDACEGADVLAVLTEWDEFKWVDPSVVGQRMASKKVVDARNILDRSTWKRAGFDYEGIGR